MIDTERKKTMKSLIEFIKEIDASEALQNELKAIEDKFALEAFLKSHDCGATANEFVSYFIEARELDDASLDAVAGGGRTPMEDSLEWEMYVKDKYKNDWF